MLPYWFGLVDDCGLLAARFKRNWLEHMEVDVLCSFKPVCKIRYDASCGICLEHIHSLFLFNVAGHEPSRRVKKPIFLSYFCEHLQSATILTKHVCMH